jgi:peroxiredoxin Q/BCP
VVDAFVAIGGHGRPERQADKKSHLVFANEQIIAYFKIRHFMFLVEEYMTKTDIAIQAGMKAPEFSLTDDAGRTVALKDFAGKKVVLYFYPKDDTPGCTTEACAFRDAYDEILAKGAVVIGVSADSVASHAGFKSKYRLPFFLLADPEKKAIQAYGVWGEKTFMGKKSMGILRTTFIIDERGTVAKVFPDVSPKEHAREVMAAL